MKTRYITIIRTIRLVDEEGKEKLKKVRLYCKINNAVPPSHGLCERMG